MKNIKISNLSQNRICQGLLQPKGTVVWKKCPGRKKFKILWTFAWNRIHAKQIIFGHFRAISVKLKNTLFFHFFKKFDFFFQAQILQALENYFFVFWNWKVQYVSFYENFLSSKNISNWLLKLNICDLQLSLKMAGNQLIPWTRKGLLAHFQPF